MASNDRAQVSDPINHLLVPAVFSTVWAAIIIFAIHWYGIIGVVLAANFIVVSLWLWQATAPIFPKERYEHGD